MLFSSLFFCFAFLPITLVLYYTICKNTVLLQNTLLLIASLFFYAWGEPKFVFVMVISIIVNYYFGLGVSKYVGIRKEYARLLLIADVIFNISILFVFKYLNFSIQVLNDALGTGITQTNILLPIGISFFTFQAMSYVIDVYRGTVEVQKNILYVALYISFFPQLIAGPIIRYKTIEQQIINRDVDFDSVGEGVRRFLIGFAKKIILANNFAIIADQAFSYIDTGNMSVGFAWLGSISYTLQIFCDFSAYSDMAIGLGAMFGFKFPENFNYPYLSTSVSEFWRRWHISLGMWFRDYVYIPLGGSHVNNRLLLVRNLFIVWALTGIWHGANWTFICWGLYYFVLLTIEKLTDVNRKDFSQIVIIMRGVLTFLLVNAGWVLFRANDICQAIEYLKNMIGVSATTMFDVMFIQYISEYWIIVLLGLLYSFAFFKQLRNEFKNSNKLNAICEIGSLVVYPILFIISISYLAIGSYNPFIYFNF